MQQLNNKSPIDQRRTEKLGLKMDNLINKLLLHKGNSPGTQKPSNEAITVLRM